MKIISFLHFLFFTIGLPLFLNAQVVINDSFKPYFTNANILYADTLLVTGNYILPIPLQKNVSSLSISGNIAFTGKLGFVRIVFTDSDENDYLVLETNTIFENNASISFMDFCEETALLDNVLPKQIQIECVDAEVVIYEVKYSTDVGYKQSIDRQIKERQLDVKLQHINTVLAQKEITWGAGKTSLSEMSYMEKKDLFGGQVPNLAGFDYYVSGIYVMKGYEPKNDSSQIRCSSQFVSEFDWRNRHGRNWITPVKGQGGYGSCWAFAAVGTVEAYVNLYYNRLLHLVLSEQDVISCGNLGSCSGGSISGALTYIKNNGVVNDTNLISTIHNRNCPERNGPLDAMGDTSVMKVVALSLAQYDEWNAQYEYWLARWYEVCGEEGEKEKGEECEILLDNVSYFSALKDNYFNSIISARLSEWLEEKEEIGKEKLYEDLRFLFAYRNQYTDNLSIAETYLAENNFREALATVEQMFEKFESSGEPMCSPELEGLQIYIRWLQQLEEKRVSIYMLPENEIEYLVNFVETWHAASHIGRGVVFANNILCGLYGICKDNYELRITNYENEIEEDNDVVIKQSSSAQSELTEFQKALENITLVPNPTTGELRITASTSSATNWTLSEVEVEIYDIYGRKQSSNLQIISSSNHLINISHLHSGIYFVKIKTEAGEVVKKIIKK